ncbi:uncharacterized protein LOC142339987 isoform X2 [Convolutriloba macropyga]|uniref:uncharacterized protein LOC142339987 isoform X2 n=1 Tax=Convolutriloba macropyga TaxID=536237 RepID=UPI003F525DDF
MQNTTESMLDEAVVHVYYADITVQNTDSQEILVLFTKYLYTTVVCVSLIGLALNWLCYRSALFLPNANSSLTPILIRLLAFWDSMALGYNLIDHGIMRLIGWGYSSKHVVVCKLFKLFCSTVRMTAMYHIVAMALDRLAAILAPIWHKNHFSGSEKAMKVAGLASVAVFTFSLFCASPRLYIFSILDNGKCALDYEAMDFGPMRYIVAVSTFGLILFLPHALFTVANVTFIHTLQIRHGKKRTGPKNEQNASDPAKKSKVAQPQRHDPSLGGKRKAKGAQSFVLMLVLLTVSCTLSSLTVGSLNVSSYIMGDKDTNQLLSFDKGSTPMAKLFSAFGDVIGAVNNSVNLFFYLVGGEVFRTAFKNACGIGTVKRSDRSKSNTSNDNHTKSSPSFIK